MSISAVHFVHIVHSVHCSVNPNPPRKAELEQERHEKNDELLKLNVQFSSANAATAIKKVFQNALNQGAFQNEMQRTIKAAILETEAASRQRTITSVAVGAAFGALAGLFYHYYFKS